MLKPSNPTLTKQALALFALLVLGGIAYLIFFRSGSSSEIGRLSQLTPSPIASSTAEELASSSSDERSQAGRYIVYSSDSFTKTNGTKILFFHAPWCPQCRALESSIEAGTIPSGVTIVKVDYDTHQDLRKKYGVTIQTTLVKLNEKNELAKKFVAYDKPTLEAVIQELLP
jgi:thiol-disulfide isomerase/thioredoxin